MVKIATVEEMRAIESAADKAGVTYAQIKDQNKLFNTRLDSKTVRAIAFYEVTL